jgi:hypothetical protein
MPPFLIFSLPRSRSFWLSRYLSYDAWHCGHDELRFARSLDDVKSWLGQPCTGTIETLAAPWWRLARTLRPDVRIIVLRRPVPDVVASLARLGFDPAAMTPLMARLDRKLDQIAGRVPDVLSVSFDDLIHEETVARVFEHCLPYRHNPDWFALMAPKNLQIPMAPLIRYMQAYQPQMDKLAKIATHMVIAAMRRPPHDIDGITIAEESFDAFLRDGPSLFAEHAILVGEAPDSYLGKNLPLTRVLEKIGATQILTARCNGRMFGYLTSIIGPSIESPSITTALHLTFFASKEFPGLGMKLQRAAAKALREKGVDHLFMQAGTRGDGSRMGVLYRRLGASDYGQLFKLDLKETS